MKFAFLRSRSTEVNKQKIREIGRYMKDTLVIGSNGYIGSALYNQLKDRVSGVDLHSNADTCLNYGKLTKKNLAKYRNIVLLAGNSSVCSCYGNIKYSLKNNVINFTKILNKINRHQKFIYASSGSVYGNTNGSIVDEKYNIFEPVSYYDLTKYTADCYSSLSKVEYYGLRFGTVNGKTESSNIVRDDLIINSMTKNAILNNKIVAMNPEVNRGILGINDLCRAIEKIIESDNNHRGLYNLASFNTNVGDISQYISNRFECSIEKLENLKNKMYDFQLDTSKFRSLYNFEFKDTMETICDSLVKDFDNINFVRRDKCLNV